MNFSTAARSRGVNSRAFLIRRMRTSEGPTKGEMNGASVSNPARRLVIFCLLTTEHLAR